MWPVEMLSNVVDGLRKAALSMIEICVHNSNRIQQLWVNFKSFTYLVGPLYTGPKV